MSFNLTGKFAIIVLIALMMVLVLQGSTTSAADTGDFDWVTGNAADVIIPTVIPHIFQNVSPSGGDAPLVFRYTMLVTNAWFDAAAPYHPTAVGAYSDLGRQTAYDGTDNTDLNIAMFYSAYRVLLNLAPEQEMMWRGMLASVGLDPDDNSTDLSTPVGIGNAAGNAVVAARENDGMNQLGNGNGCSYNCQPYADTTAYEPENSAYELSNPSKWQPNILSNGTGTFTVQQFITPQLKDTQPYSYNNPNRFKAPRPRASQVENIQDYKAQADQVLSVSANLTDEQKMMSELFDNKIRSLGFSVLFAGNSQGLNLMEFIQLDFLTNMAAFDTSIAIWSQKYRWDAVRPFSAIEYLYGNNHVTAWGGPEQGTVNDLPASQWTSYMPVANHPEYPSASASFCAAHAEVARRYLGSDNLGWTIPVKAANDPTLMPPVDVISVIEPGVTPQQALTLEFPTWTVFEETCGISRLWGGVHFYASIPAGQDIGHEVADIAYQYFESLVDGTAR